MARVREMVRVVSSLKVWWWRWGGGSAAAVAAAARAARDRSPFGVALIVARDGDHAHGAGLSEVSRELLGCALIVHLADVSDGQGAGGRAASGGPRKGAR